MQSGETSGAEEMDPRTRRRGILAATIGNGLEFYDFVTFAFFAIQIGNAFFPSHDRYLSLMGALATFGAGFIARPIGAWVLGGYADRVGRRNVMLLSMVLMGIAITTLALTPPYAVIGLAAPIIAILCRLLQGFALGAEVGASTAYMIECGSTERRGLNASMQGVAQMVASTVGPLVGLGLSLALTDEQLATFGWRVALLLGASVIPFALWMRRLLPETLHHQREAAPSRRIGPSFRQVIWCGATLMAAGTICNYFLNYTTTFAQTELGLSPGQGMAAQVVTNATGIVAALAGGLWCDRSGRRPVLLFVQVALALMFVPCLSLVLASRSLTVLIAVNLSLSAMTNLSSGALYATLLESLDPSIRSRAFSMIYAVPITLFGGTTQLFITWLIKVTGTPMSVAWYLAMVQSIGAIAVILLPESMPARRRLQVA